MSLFPNPAVEHPRRMARLAPDTINDGQQRDRLNDATADRIVPRCPAGIAAGIAPGFVQEIAGQSPMTGRQMASPQAA